MNDLRFALRQLLKNPGFTAVAVLTLALGIGVNLALFGILNEWLLRPKPVASPDELWAIEPADATHQLTGANLCRPYYDAIRRETRVFKSVIGYAGITPKLRTEEGAERVFAELVSGDYFTFLGVTPALGRGFLPEEDAGPGTGSVAVLSHTFWLSQFGGATDVIGKTVTLNDKIVEIVGVAPKGFAGLGFAQPSLWMPTSMEKVLDEVTRYNLVGRLPEPKLASAAVDLLSPVAAEVTKELAGFKDPQWFRYGYSPAFQTVRLDPVGRGSLGVSFNQKQILGFLRFAGVATMLLLIIACANVANLFFVRALQRRKEMATRIALGATRAALVRLLVCEGVMVAFLGTVGAMLAFSWIGGIIVKFPTWWHGPAVDPVPDVRIFLFAVGSALLVGVGFSLIPTIQATGFEPFHTLRDAEGGEGFERRRAWLRQALVVAQIVGSLVLLCGATLCLRSMSKQLAVDVGFRSDRIAIAPLNLERIGFTSSNALPQLVEIVRHISLVAGVERVGIARSEPLAGTESSQGIPELEGYKSPDGNPAMVNFAEVGPDTFAALGIPILYGREINPTDIELGRKVLVINESFVNQFWSGQEPLGKHIQQNEVIGVVKDVRFNRLDSPPRPMMFRPLQREDLLNAKLLVQAKGDPRRLVAGIRNELVRVHPKVLQGEVCTLRDTMKNALAVQLGALRILSTLGGLALALSAIGTYGVMSYTVTRRTREIGVRLALGATRGDVMKMILTVGFRLGLMGLVIGLPLSLSASGLLRHHLAGISPFDPLSFIAVAACVLVALIAACWWPTRRAARVDPMEALRYE